MFHSQDIPQALSYLDSLSSEFVRKLDEVSEDIKNLERILKENSH